MGGSCCAISQMNSKEEIILQGKNNSLEQVLLVPQDKLTQSPSQLKAFNQEEDEKFDKSIDYQDYSVSQIIKFPSVGEDELIEQEKNFNLKQPQQIQSIKFEQYKVVTEDEIIPELKLIIEADVQDVKLVGLEDQKQVVPKPQVVQKREQGRGSMDQNMIQKNLPINTDIFQSDMMSPITKALPEPVGSLSHSLKSKSIKIGVDIFVNLKKGSIQNYYSMGVVLGQGAFGKVWKVTHKTTGIIRAMKQIKKSSLINEEEQKLFAEMNILRNLDHPHIVKLFELYQDHGNYYLITEFLSGGELFERIKKMNTFSERRAADLMRQILLAIVYCHEKNIVHRDLKPENIIFQSDQANSNLKVIDFGTSRKFTSKSMTKQLGTPYYIAPEVLNQSYNEKCDVWSCGVILFILLCGYPPFTGKTEKDIMNKVKLGKFTFQNDDWSSVSAEAKSLITKMLTIDPFIRISALQALNDPWIQKHAPHYPINKKAINNLFLFQAKSIFKQALMSYIVSQMSTQQEIDEIQKTFQSLDKNNDGYLSKEELIAGYNQILNDKVRAEQEVNRILDLIDLNQSGKVDFSEFLLAAMNEEQITSVKKIEQAFKIFDQDGDGFISKQEMEQVMGELDDSIWQQFLLEVDINQDGRISQEEFKKILQIKI